MKILQLCFALFTILCFKKSYSLKNLNELKSRQNAKSLYSINADKSPGQGITVTTSNSIKKKSSIPVSSTNLLKNCVGAGVFSLSSRVAAISIDPSTRIPASILITLMALWSTYNFYIIGEACEITQSTTYAEIWSKTISENSSWIVQLVVTIAPIVSCLASSIVLTDIFGFTLRSIGFPPLLYENRNLVITLLSTLILFPLCSLKDLTSLQNVSKFGLLGQLTATLTLIKRYFDGSYGKGGAYSVVNAAASSMSSASNTLSMKKWFVLASLLSYCFVTHYNAPKYYNELENSNSNRFKKMASISYLSAAVIYIGTMILGLKLFGPQVKPFLLNNLSPNDPLAIVARLSFGASVLASFPLIFMAMRNWFISLAAKKMPALGGVRRTSSVLLTLIALLTTRFNDISFVGSLSGATLGVAMAFIFPPILYIRSLSYRAKQLNKKLPLLPVIGNIILLCGGIFLGVFGTYNSLFGFNSK